MRAFFVLALVAAIPAAAGQRPVHTYSIVARDSASGDLGVAVQSHWFSVGSVVTWAEAGVGAVATQSFVDVSYGPLALEMLRAGRTAPEALRGLVAADAHADVRQVAIVDAGGRVATHTGEHCIAAAGHVSGAGWSAQANLMDRDTVWGAMGRAFETTRGELPERLVAALAAAQAEGGDIRGQQSAAILVVRGKPIGRAWEDRVVDLRVEDHSDPVGELRRLLTLHRAYQEMNAGDLAMEKKDIPGAARAYGTAEMLAPDNAEMLFWHAIALVGAGKTADARPLLARAYALHPPWRRLIERLPPAGLLDAKFVQSLQAIPAAGRP
jgi:uncharacterized Ntn-hydrolase superfamily protein